ncbi:MAG: 4-(cytidine 5'-diphospho)-2-C-methyl-D-erythritol kinase [Clostridia bacterium]|nr:4-(cytidine 5'-diphospho)-2-C-methyl-D-erythritol kinase [Clostridia bacterium]
MIVKTEKIKLNANAKINLTLEVLGKREDGYHELRSVMHSIGIFDTVELELIPQGVCARAPGGVLIECPAALPYQNTARRAAESYLAAAGIDLPAEKRCLVVRLEKLIPSEAGLGGGSSDAAAVLRGLDAMFGALPTNELYEIAASIGADVPFCLHGGCALCEGIGEKLTDLPPARLPLLIVKGARGVSTGALFRSLDESAVRAEGDRSAALAAALRSGGGAAEIAPHLLNDLAPAAEEVVPEIREQTARMLASGAVGAQMTGSGSSVFGIFESREAAQKAAEAFPDCGFVRVCETIAE